jgi:hypothetical protein
MALANKRSGYVFLKVDLDKKQSRSEQVKLEISTKEKEVNTFYMKPISKRPKEQQEPKKTRQRSLKKKIAKHDLAKQELDTCKTNLAKLPRWKKHKTLQADLDKRLSKPNPLLI